MQQLSLVRVITRKTAKLVNTLLCEAETTLECTTLLDREFQRHTSRGRIIDKRFFVKTATECVSINSDSSLVHSDKQLG